MKGLMEFTSYITPDGQEFKLDYSNVRWLMTEEGFGMPPIKYITQRGPDQHGETLIDFRLEPRVIQMQVRASTENRFAYWEERANFLNMLRPNRQISGSFGPGRLRKKFPDGSMRDIDVLIQQGPVFGARSLSQWDEWGFTETIRFIAHNPIFYNPIEKGVYWGYQQTSFFNMGRFAFPTSFSLVFGSTEFSLSNTIEYPGTWLSFPEIEINGPMDNFTIYNLSTGEFIHLEYNIPSGEKVVIKLPYGNKTVTNLAGDNLIGVVSTDSDLTTFHIAPDPEVDGGENTLTISGDSSTEDTSVFVRYYENYMGL